MNRRQLMASALSGITAYQLVACGGGADASSNIGIVHLPIDKLGIIPKNVYVIRSQVDWSNFWNQHPHWYYTNPDVPVVDFSKFAVAGICEGSMGLCQALQISSGTLDQGIATFTYQIATWGLSTPSSCIGGNLFVPNLADFVLVPQSAAEVRFMLAANG